MNLQIQVLNLAYAALANTDTERGTAQFELEAEALAAILEAREQPTTVEPLNKTLAAINTLEALGYTYHGGEQWKPPLFALPVQRSPIKPVVDPDLDSNQRLAFKLGWKSAEEAHKIK
jgi:hypothetical protein